MICLGLSAGKFLDESGGGSTSIQSMFSKHPVSKIKVTQTSTCYSNDSDSEVEKSGKELKKGTIKSFFKQTEQNSCASEMDKPEAVTTSISNAIKVEGNSKKKEKSSITSFFKSREIENSKTTTSSNVKEIRTETMSSDSFLKIQERSQGEKIPDNVKRDRYNIDCYSTPGGNKGDGTPKRNQNLDDTPKINKILGDTPKINKSLSETPKINKNFGDTLKRSESSNIYSDVDTLKRSESLNIYSEVDTKLDYSHVELESDSDSNCYITSCDDGYSETLEDSISSTGGGINVNPAAPRMAKIPQSFGHSECTGFNRIDGINMTQPIHTNHLETWDDDNDIRDRFDNTDTDRFDSTEASNSQLFHKENEHCVGKSVRENQGHSDKEVFDVECNQSYAPEDYLPCERCRKPIAVWEMPEHMDFHFALDLQKDINTVVTPQSITSNTGKRKSLGTDSRTSKKIKISASQGKLDTFFSKKS